MMIHQLEILEQDEQSMLNLTEINEQLESAEVSEVLEWARSVFGDKLVMATGFGPSGVVLLDHAARIAPDLSVFYLDTGVLFPSTHSLRDALTQRFGMSFEPVSGISLERQEAEHGARLWARDPDQCCHIRKVAPLRRFLKGKQAWITGLRRDQSASRTATQIVEWDGANGLFKVNPLARWTSEQVWGHIRRHGLPYNELHDQGYLSIGCEPCTRKVTAGEDERAGRWAGMAKTECGIHQRREVA